MFSTSYRIRYRLEAKFGIKFSVTTNVRHKKKNFIRIKWQGGPSELAVSLTIRDYAENKLYSRSGYEYPEEHKTPTQLRG